MKSFKRPSVFLYIKRRNIKKSFINIINILYPKHCIVCGKQSTILCDECYNKNMDDNEEKSYSFNECENNMNNNENLF